MLLLYVLICIHILSIKRHTLDMLIWLDLFSEKIVDLPDFYGDVGFGFEMSTL